LRQYGLDEHQYPLKVIVAAITTFQLGLIVEGLSDVHEGHQELLDWIQGWIDDLEAQTPGRPIGSDAEPTVTVPARRQRAAKHPEPGA
jgi:hypothetical protein